MSFLLIGITLPEFVNGENEIITRLLDSAAISRIHLRKPNCSVDKMRKLIESIPERLHNKVSLHDCQQLALEYGCGLHLNSRCREIPSDFSGTISRSCHSLTELYVNQDNDYNFLSPIYPSISKQGYTPSLPVKALRNKLPPGTIALGGISSDKLTELKEFGFSGASMLGYIWEKSLNGKINELIKEFKCFNL